MSKEAYYFSHDANARHDPKILAMRSDYGIEGYGVYWIIVEMLREQAEYKLPMKKYIFNAIAMQVQCKDYAKENAKQFVDDCINEYELFNTDDEYFWSNSLLSRMDKKNVISDKRKAAAEKRWAKVNEVADSGENSEPPKKQFDANAMQMDANAMQVDARKGNKGKEIKESKLNKVIQEQESENATSHVTLRNVTDLEKEKDKTRIHETIFKHWLSKNEFVQHRKLTDSMKRSINGRLKDYALEEVLETINLYHKVFISDKHYYSHLFTLERFMDPKIFGEFTSESKPLERYLSKKGGQGYGHATNQQSSQRASNFPSDVGF